MGEISHERGLGEWGEEIPEPIKPHCKIIIIHLRIKYSKTCFKNDCPDVCSVWVWLGFDWAIFFLLGNHCLIVLCFQDGPRKACFLSCYTYLKKFLMVCDMKNIGKPDHKCMLGVGVTKCLVLESISLLRRKVSLWKKW